MSTQAEATQPLTLTGAQALVQALLDEGVDILFGYPGGAIIPAYDALYDARDRLRHILVRHEQGAAHAAQGYARVTGKVGVCIVTSGPGATNLVTAMTDALMDSTPLVCISGQVASSLLGADAFQEADVIGSTLAATKWSYQITDAREIPAIIAQAFRIARAGRPGPVLIDIAKNAQAERVEFTPTQASPLPPVAARHYENRRYPQDHSDLSGIERAVQLINAAQRPFLLIGQGVLVARAEQELMQLAERADIPVASTLLGLSAFPTGHRLYAGMLGMHGNYGVNVLTNEADVIIAVGLRFDDRVTGRLDRYAINAQVIHVEIDPAELNKNVPAAVGLVADAKTALQALLLAVKPAQHEAWLDRFAQCDAQERARVKNPELHPETGPLKTAEVIRCIAAKAAPDAVIISDVGQHQMLVARYYPFQTPVSYITSGGLGTMGFGLPAALGACVGARTRQVIAFIGDGGFQMTIQELGTLMQERIPLKIVIINNSFLGMVRQWQEMFFDARYSFVQLHNPDFVTIAKGYDIAGQRISAREELTEAIDNLLNTDGPYLLEVQVNSHEKVFPMIPAGDGVSDVRLS